MQCSSSRSNSQSQKEQKKEIGVLLQDFCVLRKNHEAAWVFVTRRLAGGMRAAEISSVKSLSFAKSQFKAKQQRATIVLFFFCFMHQ